MIQVIISSAFTHRWFLHAHEYSENWLLWGEKDKTVSTNQYYSREYKCTWDVMHSLLLDKECPLCPKCVFKWEHRPFKATIRNTSVGTKFNENSRFLYSSMPHQHSFKYYQYRLHERGQKKHWQRNLKKSKWPWTWGCKLLIYITLSMFSLSQSFVICRRGQKSSNSLKNSMQINISWQVSFESLQPSKPILAS